MTDMRTQPDLRSARGRRGRQAARGLALALALALALGAVSACGKKGSPEPPDEDRKNEYPRTYPDPSTY